MGASMSHTFWRKLEEKDTAYEIMDALQQLFGRQSKQVRHEITKKYMSTKMWSRTHVWDHVMTMVNYFNEAELHGSTLDEPT